MYQEFNFTIENMTMDQADELLNLIIQWAEERDLSVAGGFHQTTDDDYPEPEDEQETS
jgi:hypothetical protein